MEDKVAEHGIQGCQAVELTVPLWINGDGEKTVPLKLADYEGQAKVIYCFQAWCPGCHSRGLPDLQKMVEALKDDNHVAFLAIQTVFEGKQENTFTRMVEIQKEYDLPIPFGHDTGDEKTHHISSTMINYRTGGTPWFIFIDRKGTVVFNDFHLDAKKAIAYLSTLDE